MVNAKHGLFKQPTFYSMFIIRAGND